VPCHSDPSFGGEHEKEKANMYRVSQKTIGLLHNMEKPQGRLQKAMEVRQKSRIMLKVLESTV